MFGDPAQAFAAVGLAGPEGETAAEVIEYHADHPNKETAVRYVIVQAVIAKLEAGN
jgi:hypothetical protein